MSTTYGNLALPAIGDSITATSITDNLKKIYTNHANTSANPPWTADGNVSNANTTLSGALWYDKTNSKLNVYNGATNLWNSIGGMEVSDVAPSSPTNGTLWYDTKNKYIKFYSNENVTTIPVKTTTLTNNSKYMIVSVGTTTTSEWDALDQGTGTSTTYVAGYVFTANGSAVPASTSTGTVALTASATTVAVGSSYIIAELGSTNWNTIAGTTGLTYVVGQLVTAKVAGAGTGLVVPTTSVWQPYGAIVSPTAPVMTNALGTSNANANIGTIWFDTAEVLPKFYNGSTWTPMGSTLTYDTGNVSNTIANVANASMVMYPMFAANAATDASGLRQSNAFTSSANLTFVPNTGELKAQQVVSTNGMIVHGTTVAANYTVATNTNALSVGPITVATGITVTIAAGQKWTVI
jgi:hypothetical protein